jgi:hypothetical protein
MKAIWNLFRDLICREASEKFVHIPDILPWRLKEGGARGPRLSGDGGLDRGLQWARLSKEARIQRYARLGIDPLTRTFGSWEPRPPIDRPLKAALRWTQAK